MLLVTPFITEEDFKKTVFAAQDIFLKIYFSYEIEPRGWIKPSIADIVGIDNDGLVYAFEME